MSEQLPESRLDRIERLLEIQHVNIESLHASVSELYRIVQANSQAIRENSEHINALVRIAEIHERRLTDLEGGE
jgi:hypothetical protein